MVGGGRPSLALPHEPGAGSEAGAIDRSRTSRGKPVGYHGFVPPIPPLCRSGCLGASSVTLESRVDSRGGGEAVITNLKAVQLTAYLIQIFLEPCDPFPRPDVFRAADAALTPGVEALRQFQFRVGPLGAAHCNNVGVSVPARAELKATI
jgi:hypothetical protein